MFKHHLYLKKSKLKQQWNMFCLLDWQNWICVIIPRLNEDTSVPWVLSRIWGYSYSWECKLLQSISVKIWKLHALWPRNATARNLPNEHCYKTTPLYSYPHYIHINIMCNNPNPSCIPPKKKPGNNLNTHQSLKAN